MRSSITRLSKLVSGGISSVSFTDYPAKVMIEMMEPMEALDGRYGPEIGPSVSETSLTLLGLLVATLKVLQLPILPHHHSLIGATHDITVSVPVKN